MEVQNTQYARPGRRRISRSQFLVILAVIVVIAFGYFFYSASAGKITGLEVALKMTTFIDKTFQPDGSILGGYWCDKSLFDKCRPLSLSPQEPHVGQAIYSYFILSKISGDESYRRKADRAINYVLDGCDTNIKMCEWNFFPLTKYYQETGDRKYLVRGMLRPAESFLVMSDEDVVDDNVGHKLAALFTVTNDPRYKDRLLQIADKEIIGYNVKDPSRNIQLAWSIYVPSYSITKDKRYLVAAENVFDNLDVAAHFKANWSASAVKAADVLLSLADISEKGARYKKQARNLLQLIIDERWDTPENVKFTGDYGFVDAFAADNKPASKAALFNGWLMKSFVLIGDEKFKLPKN